MPQKDIIQQVDRLPLYAQEEIWSFVKLLLTRYQKKPLEANRKKASLLNQKFIGMWKDRKDMHDSSSWVKTMREKEWKE